MEPFIVSARKYRPETFEDVVGQGAITKTLENAIESNHLAQALLFTGPRGVGKTTCARILAKKINQHDVEYDENEDFAFNIFELDAASNNSVDGIRDLITQVRIPPQVGKYKVYIIDEVHMLSTAAFNAFLKTLEEPPKHAIFILATTEKHKIIPTILSRCQIFDFKRITVSAMREHLKKIAAKEGITADEEALQIIAQKADGALRDSLSIFDRVVSFSGKDLTIKAVTENLNVLDRDTYFQITQLILENNIPQLLVDYDQIMVKGFDGQHFLNGLASHFRDLMVCKDQRTIPLLELGESTKAKYIEQSSATDMRFLLEAIEVTNTADLKYRSSRNQRLLVELCLMQLASITAPLAGEKKKPASYIIPAAHYSDAQVAEPNTQPSAAKTNDTTVLESKPAENTRTTYPESHSTSETAQTSTPANTSLQSAEPKHVTDNEPISHQQNPKQSDSNEANVDSSQQDVRATENSKELSNQERLKQAREALLARTGNRFTEHSLSGIEKKKQFLSQKEDKVVHTDKLPERDFSQEELLLVWDKYVEHLRERGQRILASVLNIDRPQLDGTVIKLRFPNQSMKEDLEKSQGQIYDFLKRELQNYNLTIEVAVDKAVTKKYVYTDGDKYTKLVEKNPAIEVLRKTFDLEF
ncbi:DNA polymerase III subunit gamma/tau [Nonlabens ponticola]|uniref:DNA polymerase III subunit gamma/tau n=1 Tax=Nonlabens ponticola TaxID=2496866 RepID=A0A3S9MZP7_9FLAO|nr:DNA polymerase III subunit gamma/tau [Nonlabens ponticola]AZQ44628.1 DNA polymerase III subunit gamma/tau [Nonlabens ponticola]